MDDMERKNLIDFASIQQILGYSFKNIDLLLQALTHTTFAYESKEETLSDNQRLEFLGDSILGMVIAEYLYEKDSTLSEGELTQRRASLVNRDNLASKARRIGLSEYILLGKGEKKINGRNNPTNLSGALEAVIGAIYLDGGLEEARRFIIKVIF